LVNLPGVLVRHGALLDDKQVAFEFNTSSGRADYLLKDSLGRVVCVLEANDILTASITIGSIFTAFLATSESIILTFNSPLMSKVRKTSYFRLLMSYLGEGIWSALAFCILALVGYFLDNTSYPRLFVVIWFFCSAATFFTFFRITYLLMKMIGKE